MVRSAHHLNLVDRESMGETFDRSEQHRRRADLMAHLGRAIQSIVAPFRSLNARDENQVIGIDGENSARDDGAGKVENHLAIKTEVERQFSLMKPGSAVPH